MKLSDVLAHELMKQGVEIIFGYQGGSITHMIDSFDKAGIRYVQTYNEQGASLAADAYARVSKSGFGVVIGTNGPGATNMITGIANAYCDSVPVLFLTGQVHTFAMKKNAGIRQESFQEIDILSIVKSITKYAVTIMDKKDALYEMKKAIRIAKEGRPGPVLVDIPVDIQGEDLERTPEEEISSTNTDIIQISDEKIKTVADLLSQAEKPLIIAGGGLRASHAVDSFRTFVKHTHIPVVVSLMGLDVLNHKDRNFVGFIGAYGNRYANMAVQKADFILVLGSRLDMKQTGKRKDLFAPNAKIIHVDIDESELGHFISKTINIRGNINDFLEKAETFLQGNFVSRIEPWRISIERWKEKFPDDKEFPDEISVNPNKVIKEFGKIIAKDSIVCSDVGQNQMWVAQSLRINGERVRILNSGGLGTMGYSLPASIGAYYASPMSQIVAIMGDGGLQMNIQELQVIGQYQLPIMVIVLNNHALGMIRDVHEKYYSCRYIGSVEGFSMPDLEILAKAYKLEYKKIMGIQDIGLLKELCQDKPYLVEFEFSGNTYIRPELLGNDGLDCQIPYKKGADM